jgi:hypothetical protein
MVILGQCASYYEFIILRSVQTIYNAIDRTMVFQESIDRTTLDCHELVLGSLLYADKIYRSNTSSLKALDFANSAYNRMINSS